MKLSPHFSLEELIHSQTAIRLNIDNTPSPYIIDNLKYLAQRLEEVRSLLNSPMLISSGYRSHLLNDHLGSKKTSAHTKGLAIDFISPSFGPPKKIVKMIMQHDIDYDQIILEYNNWVHLAFARNKKPRRQALVINRQGVKLFEASIS